MSLTRDFTPFDSRNEGFAQPSRRTFPKSWGAEYLGDGEVLFRIWAPDLERLRAQIAGRNREMLPAGEGWFTLTTDGIAQGTPYRFVMPDGAVMADPASRAQAGGIDGPSMLVDPTTYHWHMPDWSGHAWEEAVLYEVHIGTFTPEGTFRAAIERLREIASLGVTMLQVMPVNQFPGNRGWGYDGVLPYAPHHAYGEPDDMKAFIDAAHRHGLSVVLDVVHNRFGPRGSLFQAYVPSFFDPDRATPSGPAINFGQRPVRQFFIENALYWLEEYNLDGLRLDAVDQINDDASQMHVLWELAKRVQREVTGRRRHLVMDDHRNITHYLERGQAGRALLYDAVWNHDVCHAAHVVATGETAGQAGISMDEPVRRLARGLAEGFICQGETGPDGEARGEPSGHLSPVAFINFLQDHGQIGYRASGERLASRADPRMLRVLTAILILSPQIPLLFMGDDYCETQGFRFFSDDEGELANTLPDSRIDEGANFDPNAVEAFDRSKLHWNRARTPEGQVHRDRMRTLIAKRRAHIVPGLLAVPPHAGRVLDTEDGVIAVDWRLADRLLQLRANLTAKQAAAPPVSGTVIHAESAEIAAGEILPGLSMVAAVSPG
ncbi:malto-oligosyltrehalose trehalohydrolase [Neorhizobium galegae]|uniref:malto-oligosyltrehalose trehalohydrolase n=1 Tax=Neorhizobium galegae TaxID=399 RepID=UPI000620E78D|nr:malto-oligosyltrehalose trehalohydrolase [Neorhizobium galegae]MCQ1766491.1 malto-oligosyltrehalose trehalohydrolase [Neorhizobium galegae]MCQ1845405.1 malto-oligosyltrehalose trehalohydrolase [Neorhizobium galegae]CDZ36280.1 4-alpha-D-((1->4)-alpha-D-glucano)trehalose trehalohydrolase [Neorhizobium galegae bv. officinalis]